MSKHTPGPWKLSNEGDLILDSENNVLAYLVLAYLRWTKTNGGLSAQVEANACLMAAAPELLESLKELLELLEGVGMGFIEASEKAEKLIAKIEGVDK